MSNISEKLDESIERSLDKIASLDVGSKERSSAIDQAVQLHKLRMDELKLESEVRDRDARRIFETQKQSLDELARDEELKESKKDRYFRVGVAAAEIILPLALYGWLSYVGYAREFDGAVTSDTLKRVLNSIKPKR